jgi:hypothetical protein
MVFLDIREGIGNNRTLRYIIYQDLSNLITIIRGYGEHLVFSFVTIITPEGLMLPPVPEVTVMV